MTCENRIDLRQKRRIELGPDSYHPLIGVHFRKRTTADVIMARISLPVWIGAKILRCAQANKLYLCNLGSSSCRGTSGSPYWN